MERIFVGLAVVILSAGTLFAAPDAIIFQGGDVRISGDGNGLVFPNGSIQTTAEVAGPQGLAGLNSLIAILDEGAGVNCTNGGVKIQVGLDQNRNSALDANEVLQTKYLCNGNASTSPDATGKWAFYIKRPFSNSESKWGYMSITQSAGTINTIAGTINTGGTINGNISGAAITLNYVMPCGSIPLLGTVWGNSMSGTSSMGNWRAEKVASVPSPIVVTSKTITIDGNVTDWAGISPIITDAVGDSNSTSGSDISAVYVAKDNSNLYFRIDLVNGTPGNGLYFGITYDGDNFTNNSPQRGIFIDIGAHSASVAEWATSVCGTSHSNVATGVLSINGNLMEISVPRSALNNLPASGFIYVWDDPSGNHIDNTDRVAVTF